MQTTEVTRKLTHPARRDVISRRKIIMPLVPPLPESDVTDEKTARTYERIKELLKADAVPEMFQIYGRVPAFLQDFYMNFRNSSTGMANSTPRPARSSLWRSAP
jgi:hypothetical protein